MSPVWDRLVMVPEPPPAGDLPPAAVLAAIYPDPAGELRLILTKRPMTMPTHAGHIAFPGGRPDPADDGPQATALREAFEEVGLDPAAVEVVGFLSPIHTVEYSLLVVTVVGRLTGPPALTPSPREVDKVLTPRLADLADEASWKSEVWRGRKVWFYDLEDEVLWGATGYMVRSLLGMQE